MDESIKDGNRVTDCLTRNSGASGCGLNTVTHGIEHIGKGASITSSTCPSFALLALKVLAAFETNSATLLISLGLR